MRIIALLSLNFFFLSFQLLAEPRLAKGDKPQINPSYVETGDLAELKKRGLLRVLVPFSSEYESYLPRQGFPLHYESAILEKFAKNLGLKAVFLYVDTRDQMIPELLAGKGDIIAANLTITKSRKKQVNFTIAMDTVREVIVSRNKDKLHKRSQLKGRTIAIHKSSSFWETAQKLKKRVPGLSIKAVSELIPVEAIIDGVADGDYDLTIADSNLIEATKLVNANIKSAFHVTKARPIAWGVRPNAKKLLQSLNRFLDQEQLRKRKHKIAEYSWAQIKKHKTLRVLTRNNSSTYFLWKGELLGFEYALIKRFAKKNGLHVEMIVPPGRDDLLKWLREGRGDVVAASLTIDKDREKQGIRFSRYYNKVTESVITDKKDKSIAKLEDLKGRTFHVRKSSSYWKTLKNLQETVSIKIKAVAEDMETEEIIEQVAEGKFDLTLADSHIVQIELVQGTNIHAPLTLGKPVKHGWAVRKENTVLLAKINQYLKKTYRSAHYNITYKKYFKNPRSITKYDSFRVDSKPGGKISPYQKITKKYAEKYDLDWRLVTAQMYQESRFNPFATSWVGAKGLMQVMPRTGRQFGFTKLQDPEIGIHAGTRYLAWLRDRFKTDLDVKNRMWFMLASYNAGLGHVIDARTLARRKGWDKNVWFGNVEKAMLLLSKPEYHKKARHGYVRGKEPVDYVRKIRDRYQAYLLVAPKEPLSVEQFVLRQPKN